MASSMSVLHSALHAETFAVDLVYRRPLVYLSGLCDIILFDKRHLGLVALCIL